MKFAQILGERIEAHPGKSATCPVCEASVIAKCGEHRAWHWAHRGVRNCDPWWEPETEWHREWKNRFPAHWQEIIRRADSGEKHIADVMTDRGVVLEFQHSALRRDEREAREAYYQNMVWVVDGLRRIRDRPHFFSALGSGKILAANPMTIGLRVKGNALIRDWGASAVPVFFDFGDAAQPDDPLNFIKPILWALKPQSPSDMAILTPITKASFGAFFAEGRPYETFDVSAALNRAGLAPASPPLPPPPSGRDVLREHFARTFNARARRRF
ncbi:competence protein CoiA [Bradyrhizobium acaciae]|uniref:competence protein CoiA n=1 Tax=Bradyrhizobium acaciae TaxID=2683706 RepID=UPI001E443F7E|nr:competence protein CoiA family protein [Bradyrhizobium acaciae]MCC8978906.1 competence protein [Bradyrhizobium acaciae]